VLKVIAAEPIPIPEGVTIANAAIIAKLPTKQAGQAGGRGTLHVARRRAKGGGRPAPPRLARAASVIVRLGTISHNRAAARGAGSEPAAAGLDRMPVQPQQRRRAPGDAFGAEKGEGQHDADG